LCFGGTSYSFPEAYQVKAATFYESQNDFSLKGVQNIGIHFVDYFGIPL
jgi:hypothetical protein